MKKFLTLLAVSGMLWAGCSGGTTKQDEKPVATLACSAGMSEYKLANSPLQFCYDKNWGDPLVMETNAKRGSAKTISFDAAGNIKAPMLLIEIESKDFLPTEGTEAVKFEFLNAMNANEDQLKTQIKNAAGYEEKDIQARKADVGGVRAIRAVVGGKVNKIIYFVPFAYEDHNMIISGNSELAETIDELVFDMAL